MRIFIPSKGRATVSKQTTVAALVSWGVTPTLLVDSGCGLEYTQCVDNSKTVVLELPPIVKGIGCLRDFIVRELSHEEPVLMLDDDLTFFVRRNDDPTKFRNGTVDEFLAMLRQIEVNLKKFPLVGIASREGGNRVTDKYIYDTRILRLLAYDPKVLIKHDIRFSDTPVMEDFHVALSLLERGYHNLVLNHYCHNQAGSGLEGGCSTYRTPEVQAAAAHKLAKLHPGFVKVVTKETKGAWGGGTRTDVHIQWKKAYNGT